MKIHEYQAKEVFARYGISVPPSRLASSAAEAGQATEELGRKAVLKAQVHAGAAGSPRGATGSLAQVRLNCERLHRDISKSQHKQPHDQEISLVKHD